MNIFADEYNCCCPNGESKDVLPALEEGGGKEQMNYRLSVVHSNISNGHPWEKTHKDALYCGLELQMLFPKLGVFGSKCLLCFILDPSYCVSY